MNQYENIQRGDSIDKKMEVIRFINRLTYVHYDLALYYNNYKPKKYAILRELDEIIKMGDKITDFLLFDVYLALITIYYEFAILKDRSVKTGVLTKFHDLRRTEQVQMSFLIDDYVEPDNLENDDNEMYLPKPVDNVISSIKKNYPKIMNKIEEIAKSKVRVTSYISSFKIGGSTTKGKKTRKNRKN
jgi:hypothetical protein